MVEHMIRHQEVVGLNPAGCWAFFLLLSLRTFLHHWSVLNQVPQGVASPTVKERNGCLAVLPGGKQAN